ncbi:alpha/beta fold hydrolase [Hamadaea tsunoensis]|uniref:alpha/beta fold hydrolase n=1 Tax=Hamadaea tsunoensis TaxID=53368 RepID=UPI00041643AD|nr:alpha/beta fold hydrolase [Hamadaea tsunoensis]
MINHVRRGQGEPLVLVHGIGHRWQAWQPVLDRLAAHHEVIAVDLPGFGASPVPEAGMPQGMPATVEVLASVLDSWGLDRPHVAGYSLGGAISLELAAAGLARSATAFSPAGFYTEAERRRALRILGAMRANTYLPAPVMKVALRSPAVRSLCFGSLVVHTSRISPAQALGDALAFRRGRGYSSVARSARGYAFPPSLSTSEVPVTIGWGEADRIFGVHQAERAAAALPGARVERLRGCGHVPMSDAPDEVVRLILETTSS